MDELPGWPALTDEDMAAVLDVLRSNRLTQLSNGIVAEFENAMSSRHGGLHAIAVSTGTAAVHLALCALDVGPGDEVIVPAHTFVGSASPIVYQGATPVFADVDPRTYCIDPASVADLLTERTRAVIAVHLNGCAADLDALRELTAGTKIALIEDCAQALGTRIGAVPVGVTGELSCFSFFEQKVITTGGEGGFVLTASDEHADRIRRLRSHGEGPDGGRFLWSHEVGYNYRLTAMQAAIGLSQFKRLDELVDARRANAAHLTRRLASAGLPGLELPVEPPGTTHAFWRYVVRAVDRPAERLMDELRAEGVPAMLRYPYAVHRQPAFAAYAGSACPVAERLSAELLTIPAHPALRPEHLDAIADRIVAVLERS